MSLNELINKALKDDKFKDELKRNPKKVVEKEFNIKLDADIEIRVLEDTETVKYLVIPYIDAEEQLSDEMLKGVAGGGRRTLAGIDAKRERYWAEQARKDELPPG